MITDPRLDRRPTICQLLVTLDVGGAEVLAREFALHAHADFRVVFACLDAGGPLVAGLQQAGYLVEVLRRRPGIDLRCAWRVARFCRRQNVRLIHAQLYPSFFYAGVSRLFGRSIPILYTEHGRIEPYRPVRRRILGNRWLLRRCDRVIAVGQWVREGLISNEGLPADRTEVVCNGIDLSAYDGQSCQRGAVRKELGLRDSDFVIVQVARLVPVKNHRLAIHALRRLVGDRPQVRLLLVGAGPEQPAVQQLVCDLGLQEHVLLLGRRHDVPRLLSAADAALLTSVMEGIPLAMIEAMAAGLPCVATRVGGQAEVIADGQTGLLAEPADPESTATQLARLIDNPELRRQMGEAGRKRALDLFDARTMHRSYDRIYRSMLGLTTC
jgi:glycosyltransferase involved in cell wall biosynthesis